MSAGHGDVVFANRAVYTMDPLLPGARAVTVHGADLIHVGDDRVVVDSERAASEVIDLGDKMVLPGFMSGHDHLVGDWMGQLGVDVSQTGDSSELREMVGDHARRNPDNRIVKGFRVEVEPRQAEAAANAAAIK